MTLKTIQGIAVASVKTWNGIAAASVKTVNTETWTHGGPSGQLWAWGINGAAQNGDLGLNNTTYYSSPKQVGALTTWSRVQGLNNSAYHVAAVQDGKLFTWGANLKGQLGLNNYTNTYSSPKQVGALTTWSVVWTGDKFTFAIKTDGTLWSWGHNQYGVLGLGNTTDYSSPKQVGALTTWITGAATDGKNSAAIQTDGTLWTVGAGLGGALGQGDVTSRSSLTQVGALTTWSTISGNGGSAKRSFIAIKTDGTLWAWGKNYQGQLGLGNTTDYSSPKQVGALTTWSTIEKGFTHSLGVTTGGALWAWGQGAYGQLGLGNTTNYSSPKQVGALTTWSNTAGGYKHTIAITTGKTLWAWGRGAYGGLGLGNVTSYSSPKQVGALTTWIGPIEAGQQASMGIKTA